MMVGAGNEDQGGVEGVAGSEEEGVNRGSVKWVEQEMRIT